MLLYPLDAKGMLLEDWIGFCLGVLFAVTINAEAQAFMAAILGDARKDPKDRFHFNPLLHLDIAGTIAFAAAGFGWPRGMPIDRTRFKHPRGYPAIIRLTGPAANFLLGSIASSVATIIGALFKLDSKMFDIVMGVNFSVAIFHLLPLPPLGMSAVAAAFLPARLEPVRQRAWRILPYALALLLVVDRLLGTGLAEAYQRIMVLPVMEFFTRY